MAIYHYNPGSLIEQADILTNESGGVRAYLHARADATPEQLAQVQAGIRALGWKAVPYIHEGKPTLEIRGFKKPAAAAEKLAAHGWTIGPPSVELQEGDVRTRRDKIGNGTLRASGGTYVFADIMFYIYSFMQYFHERHHGPAVRFANKMNIGAGFGYGLGSLALLFYGSRDQSQNTIQTATKKVQEYLRGEQVEVSKDSAMHNVTRKEHRGFFGSINHTLARYPSETLNSIYVGVGSLIGGAAVVNAIAAARRGNLHERNSQLLELGLGAVTTTSALIGLTVKERKREEGEEKPHSLSGRVVEWVREKPLRATGIGYLISTGFHIGATVNKYRKGDPIVRKTAVFRGLFAAGSIGAEGLLAVSSKGHGEGVKPDKSIDSTVIATTADLIHRQPLEKQEALVCQLAGHMASREVLGGKAEDIQNELRMQLAGMQQNPWVHKVMPAAPALKAANDTITPANDIDMNAPGTKVTVAEHGHMQHAPVQQAAIS